MSAVSPTRSRISRSVLIDLVIDWKTDVNPSVQQIELYREQMRDYLVATGAPEGLLVFVTTGQLVRVRPDFPCLLPPPMPLSQRSELQGPSSVQALARRGLSLR